MESTAGPRSQAVDEVEIDAQSTCAMCGVGMDIRSEDEGKVIVCDECYLAIVEIEGELN